MFIKVLSSGVNCPKLDITGEEIENVVTPLVLATIIATTTSFSDTPGSYNNPHELRIYTIWEWESDSGFKT